MGTLPQQESSDSLAQVLAICQKMHSERDFEALLDLIAREAASLLDCGDFHVHLGATPAPAGPEALAVTMCNRQGEPIGSLQAVNKRKGAFAARDEARLRTLAAHAAIAIETAQIITGLRGNERPKEVEVGRTPEPAKAGAVSPSQAMQPLRTESLKQAVEELERQMIRAALRQTHNNQQRAARVLGLSRQGLINKLKRYSILP